MKNGALLACFVASMLAACASDVAFHQAPKPGPGEALVYVYRLDTWPVVRTDAFFSVNGKRVVALPANSYTWLHVPAGKHRLEQTWDLLHVPPARHQDFSAREGSISYLRLDVQNDTMQMKWRLSDVPAKAASGEISRCSFYPAKP